MAKKSRKTNPTRSVQGVSPRRVGQVTHQTAKPLRVTVNVATSRALTMARRFEPALAFGPRAAIKPVPIVEHKGPIKSTNTPQAVTQRKTREPVKQSPLAREPLRCKPRPKGYHPPKANGGGGGRKFVPWCG